MNRIYRKVWNKALGVWAVASELASGDSPGAVTTAAFIDRRQSRCLVAAIALALGSAGIAIPLSAMAQSVEVGDGAAASATRTTAIGSNSHASATGAVAAGADSSASGVNSSAIGARPMPSARTRWPSATTVSCARAAKTAWRSAPMLA